MILTANEETRFNLLEEKFSKGQCTEPEIIELQELLDRYYNNCHA